MNVGDRVALDLPDNLGSYGRVGRTIEVHGTVREIDARGVYVDLDQQLNGVTTCYATTWELRPIATEMERPMIPRDLTWWRQTAARRVAERGPASTAPILSGDLVDLIDAYKTMEARLDEADEKIRELTGEIGNWEEWSNDLAALMPEDVDEDMAQEDIILRYFTRLQHGVNHPFGGIADCALCAEEGGES